VIELYPPGFSKFAFSNATCTATPWESPGTHAHVACAECLPEVFVIRDAPGREGQPPLIDMSFVKGARMNLRCSLCDQEGACTQCAMKKCYVSFHPLCARASVRLYKLNLVDP
jgi:hypothetical protein